MQSKGTLSFHSVQLLDYTARHKLHSLEHYSLVVSLHIHTHNRLTALFLVLPR